MVVSEVLFSADNTAHEQPQTSFEIVLLAGLKSIHEAVNSSEFGQVTWGDADATLLSWDSFDKKFVAEICGDEMTSEDVEVWHSRIAAAKAEGVEYVDLEN